MATKCVNLDNLNPCIKVMEYAVRGPLVIRATEIEKELEQVGELEVVAEINVCVNKSESQFWLQTRTQSGNRSSSALTA